MSKNTSSNLGKPWFLYLIRCDDNSLYTGITTDVDKRLEAHQSNKGAKYLKGKKSLSLVFQTKQMSRSQALKLEAKIKKFKKDKKESLVAGFVNIDELLD